MRLLSLVVLLTLLLLYYHVAITGRTATWSCAPSARTDIITIIIVVIIMICIIIIITVIIMAWLTGRIAFDAPEEVRRLELRNNDNCRNNDNITSSRSSSSSSSSHSTVRLRPGRLAEGGLHRALGLPGAAGLRHICISLSLSLYIYIYIYK